MSKGRSFEIPRTIVPTFPAANWLNLRTEVAHTEVSRLGNIFSMSFFPLSSDRERVERSDFTSVKSIALLPFAGRLPEVFTGFPLSVIFAIAFFFKFNHSFMKSKH